MAALEHGEMSLEMRKKLGFSMSAMPARVSFDEKQRAYVASYISGSAEE